MARWKKGQDDILPGHALRARPWHPSDRYSGGLFDRTLAEGEEFVDGDQGGQLVAGVGDGLAASLVAIDHGDDADDFRGAEVALRDEAIRERLGLGR